MNAYQLLTASLAVSGLMDSPDRKKLEEFFDFTLRHGYSLYIKNAAIALCEAGHVDSVEVINKSMKKFALEVNHG